MLVKIESMKATQPQKSKNTATIFSKGTESIYSIPLYNTKSHQPLYLEEILTQKISENWEGFNS